MRIILMAAITTFLATGALADVQLVIKDGEGGKSIFSSDGKMARIEDNDMPEYAIINFTSGEFSMVDPQRNEVMQAKLGVGGAAVTDSGGVKVSLQDKGGGPAIAGYSTRKFDFSANGTSCGTIYASSKLLKNPGVRALFEAMRSMAQQSRRMMGGMGSMGGVISLCEQADLFLADALDSAGAPMRVIDEKGQLESEVVAVDTNKNFASGHYQFPAGMKVVNMEDMMKQSQQQTQEMMKDVPNINELLQQMEGSGIEIPESALEQLKQLQQQQQ